VEPDSIEAPRLVSTVDTPEQAVIAWLRYISRRPNALGSGGKAYLKDRTRPDAEQLR